MSLFIPLHKADASQRLVYGHIDETPDRSGEVFDYASSKPYFADWSRSISNATNGKSLGNIRAMHGAVAAGKLENINFDDATKSISLVARIIDNDEWEKVEQGVYTGFSPGGRYIKRWNDNGLTRYTAQPSEISIVDLPCIPSAGFTMVKADGTSEMRGFRAPSDGASGRSDIPLEKSGARNSEADLQHIQQMHDTAVKLGASCHGANCACHGGGEAEKSALASDLAKADGMISGLKTELDLSKAENSSLRKRIEELEAQPAPGGPALKVVSKSQDLISSEENNLLDEIHAMPDGLEKSRAFIKLSHLNPLPGHRR